MDVLALPFNQFLGLELAKAADNFIYSLPDRHEYRNHVGTVHAVVQIALAEATAGEYCYRCLGEDRDRGLPLLRKVETSFARAAKGRLFGRAGVDPDELQDFLRQFHSKRRGFIRLKSEVVDENDLTTMTAFTDWYVTTL